MKGDRDLAEVCGVVVFFRLFFSGEFEAEDAEDDEGEAEEAGGGDGVAKENHAADDGADGSDAGPDSVGGADRQGFGGDAEEADADGEGGDGAEGGPKAGEAFGGFEADGPEDFEEAGDEEDDPGHRRWIDGWSGSSLG